MVHFSSAEPKCSEGRNSFAGDTLWRRRGGETTPQPLLFVVAAAAGVGADGLWPDVFVADPADGLLELVFVAGLMAWRRLAAADDVDRSSATIDSRSEWLREDITCCVRPYTRG
jgi:hypothetical protein